MAVTGVAGAEGAAQAQTSEPSATSSVQVQGAPQEPAALDAGGNHLGLKPLLAGTGISLVSRYVSETAWNATGGKRRDITEAGELDIGAEFDLQRLAGTDGTFKAMITYRRGSQLDRRAGLGTLQEVQEIYGRGHAWRLTQFWYEQRIHQGAIALKVGRTSPGEDFATFSCSFQNLSFCGSQPGNLVTDYWYNWPISQWGARLRIKRGGAYVQIAAYEENPRNLDDRFALGRFSGATGVLVPLEIGITSAGETGGPVDSYKIGGWLSTADAPDVLLDANGRTSTLSDLPPLQRKSAHGFWLSLQQQLTGRSRGGESVSGLSVFANITLADRRTSMIDNQVAIGLFKKRVMPSMGDDELGLGLVRTHINDRFVRGEELAGRYGPGSEYAVELYYGFRPVDWVVLRPNLQWIHRSGGRRFAPVGVLGLKAVFTF